MSNSNPPDLAGTHVELLGRGVGEWNAWRADNPRTRPVLRGARLDDADLRGFDFAFINGIGGGTDFRGASLRHAKLCGCDCRCADFSGADLSDADLSDADLGGTDLSGSVLRSANLSRASIGDFIGADLKRATMVRTRAASVDGSYADLTGADLTGATFSHVDLQHARSTTRRSTAPRSRIVVFSAPRRGGCAGRRQSRNACT